MTAELVDDPGEQRARAWRAFSAAPDDLRAKRDVVRLLRQSPDLVSAERRDGLLRLIHDPDVDPDDVASAGWNLVLRELPDDPAAVAAAIERDRLALGLLTEACVCVPEAERRLTDLRRWLLLHRKAAEFPRLARALIAQAEHNGGAWLITDDERLKLDESPELGPAYLPRREPPGAAAQFEDATTTTVADQYVHWPYPSWSRITVPEPSTVPELVEKLDGGRSSDLPVASRILVAGCGTGREAATLARRFPDAQVTAIDISEASLAYARAHCAGLAIEFHLVDLHEVARLGRRFDLIACSGVLHHLPDPEAGWAKLVEVLSPRGVMKVMVYSRVARLRVAGARALIADLRDRTVDDDLLREIRARLIAATPQFVADFVDFYSLSGVHDLLLNRHEDLFDVPRIAQDIDRLGLELLAFRLPTKDDEARYRREHPEDPLFRDVKGWTAMEKSNPLLFAGMYEFWCRRA